MIESVEVEQVTVTSTAVDAVTVGVEVESVQVGITGPQGATGATGAGGAASATWSAEHTNGTTSQEYTEGDYPTAILEWLEPDSTVPYDNKGGAFYGTGTFQVIADPTGADRGNILRMTTTDATPDIRAFRWVETRENKVLVARADCYVPTAFLPNEGSQFINLMQFKATPDCTPSVNEGASQPAWALYGRPSGSDVSLEMGWAWGGANGVLTGPFSGSTTTGRWYKPGVYTDNSKDSYAAQPANPRLLPIGEWFTITMMIDQSPEGTYEGRLYVWINDELCWAFENIVTGYDVSAEAAPPNDWGVAQSWSINNYHDGTNQASVVIYWDNPELWVPSLDATVGQLADHATKTGDDGVHGMGTAASLASSAILLKADNLSGLASASTARTNLGLGSAATASTSTFAQTANNLSDLASKTSSRANLFDQGVGDPVAKGDILVYDGSLGAWRSLHLGAATTGQVLTVDTAADKGVKWDDQTGSGVTDHGALTGLSDDDHPQYVLNTGDTMTGALLVTGSDATQLLRAMVTGNTNTRAALYSDGRIISVGSDAALPTWGASTDPQVFINHTRPGASGNGTGLRIRGSASSTITQPFAIEDTSGIPIYWMLTAGGSNQTDAFKVRNDVFNPTEMASFVFRDANGSGAIISQGNSVALCFGTTDRVWTGDPVGSGKTLGLYLQRSTWICSITTTSGSTAATVSGMDARLLPLGATILNAAGLNLPTGIASGTTVAATPTSSTLTLSQNATASGTITARVVHPDIIAVRAYLGLEIHGDDGSGSATGAGRVALIGGMLVLSSDQDTSDGWAVSKTETAFRPLANETQDIGTSSRRVRAVWAKSGRVSEHWSPRSGVTTADLGQTTEKWRRLYATDLGTDTDPITVAYVSDIQGTVNDGWVLAPNAWTRVSDTQFTISSATNFTSRYQKGTRLKWVDSGGTKYGVVSSSSFASSTTTVNLIPTTDFVMASSPATGSRWYSHQASPQGYPTWFNYTPTLAGWSSNPPNGVYRWQAVGNWITVTIRQPTNGTSNATTTTITTPVSSANITNAAWFSPATVVDNGVTQTTYGHCALGPNTNVISCFLSPAGAAWTGSGSKRIGSTAIAYEF